MTDYKDISAEEIGEMEHDFGERLTLAHDVFGARTFRYPDEGVWKLSQPLYDAVMVAVDRLYEQKKRVIAKKGAVQSAIAKLFDDEDAYGIIVGRPNTAKAIRDRIDLIESTVKSAAGL
jgi:hypothetical protein